MCGSDHRSPIYELDDMGGVGATLNVWVWLEVLCAVARKWDAVDLHYRVLPGVVGHGDTS